MNRIVVTEGVNEVYPFLIDDPSISHGVIVHCLDEEFCSFLPLPHFLARKDEIACMLFPND
jgi:hypothetical protein